MYVVMEVLGKGRATWIRYHNMGQHEKPWQTLKKIRIKKTLYSSN